MSDYLTENIENYVNFMNQEGLCENTIKISALNLSNVKLKVAYKKAS